MSNNKQRLINLRFNSSTNEVLANESRHDYKLFLSVNLKRLFSPSRVCNLIKLIETFDSVTSDKDKTFLN